MQVRSTRHWSDWVGVVAFTAIGVNVYRQSPVLGILILPGLLQELIVAVSFLLRPRPRRTTPGWMPRLVAYANTFGVMLFLLYAASRHPDWIRASDSPGLRIAGASVSGDPCLPTSGQPS